MSCRQQRSTTSSRGEHPPAWMAGRRRSQRARRPSLIGASFCSVDSTPRNPVRHWGPARPAATVARWLPWMLAWTAAQASPSGVPAVRSSWHEEPMEGLDLADRNVVDCRPVHDHADEGAVPAITSPVTPTLRCFQGNSMAPYRILVLSRPVILQNVDARRALEGAQTCVRLSYRSA